MNSLPDLVTAAEDARALAELNRHLESRSAEARVAWALEHLPSRHALSSSFGAQAAASLHLLTSAKPDIPVILIDTGYLFPETYRFVDELSQRLALNLKIYRPERSVAWLRARYGELWQQGLDGIERYNRLHKVEPMQRALRELGIRTWFAGLRRDQADSRADTSILSLQQGRWKFHPIADWSDRDVGHHLSRFGLPYHPLWHEGYVSIGDVHTTRRFAEGMRVQDTRFFGLKRECGLHVEA